MDWHVPLIVSALVFGAFLVWRLRPSFDEGSNAIERARALKEAKLRIDAAKDDAARAKALCDAGEACAVMVGRAGSAATYFLRAMRAAPESVEVVERAAKSLATKPLRLEALLWRRLGTEPWDGPARDAAIAALRELAFVYRRSLRYKVRGRALAQALAALGAPIPPEPEEDSRPAP
jgi:hypothetical protein